MTHYPWCDTTACVEGEDRVAGTRYWIHTSTATTVTVPSGMPGETTDLEVRVQQTDAGTQPRPEPGEDGQPYIAVPGLPLLHPAHARQFAAQLAAAADVAEPARVAV